MKTKLDIAKNWLPRYTGTRIDEFGDYMLLTNFNDYVENFAKKFKSDIKGIGRPMQTSTNSDVPMIPEGIKTEDSDRKVTKDFSDVHLEIGIEAMTELGEKGEHIKHLTF